MDKIQLIKQLNLDSTAIDFNSSDIQEGVKMAYNSALAVVEDYIGYPLKECNVEQYVDYDTNHVTFCVQPFIGWIEEQYNVKFLTEKDVIFGDYTTRKLLYTAGYEEIPDDIQVAIVRITRSILDDFLNNTINQSTSIQNIGGQSVTIQRQVDNVIQKELNRIAHRKSYNAFDYFRVS